MTVSLVVIMFELTGSLDFVVPAMVTVLVANWVGEAIYKRGIYDAHIHQNGYPFLDAREKFESTTIAKDVMHPRPGGVPLRVVSQDTTTMADIENLLKDTHYNGYPVVDNEISNTLIGFVERTDLKLLIKHVHQIQKDSNADNQSAQSTFNSSVSNSSNDSAFNDMTVYSTITSEASNSQLFRNPSPLQIPKKLIDTTPLIIDETTPMEKVVDMFIKLGARHILVVKKGKLLGLVTRKDTMRHVKELEEEEERKKEGKSHGDEHEHELIQIISQHKFDETNTEINYARL
jgi:chloride channel 3/4/5